jgi:hypothetical protein
VARAKPAVFGAAALIGVSDFEHCVLRCVCQAVIEV